MARCGLHYRPGPRNARGTFREHSTQATKVDRTYVQAIGKGLVVHPSGFATVLPTEPRLHGALRQRAIELVALGNPHVRIASVLEDRFRKRLESAAEAGPASSDGTGYSDVEFLPWEFPRLPFRYPAVPLGPTKVVVFDIVGTILVSILRPHSVVERTDVSMDEGSRTGHRSCAKHMARSVPPEAVYDAEIGRRPVHHTRGSR